MKTLRTFALFAALLLLAASALAQGPVESTALCPSTMLVHGVCTNPNQKVAVDPSGGPHVTQVVGMPNRGGSNPDPKLLMQVGQYGRGEYLPLMFVALSCNDAYVPALYVTNQKQQTFSPFSQQYNRSYKSLLVQQIFDYQSSAKNDIDGWNIFSAYWYQVGWFCDATAIAVSGQSQLNPIVNTQRAKCLATQSETCSTPVFSVPQDSYSLVLAIGSAVGLDNNPAVGFVSPGPGCSIVGGETTPLGTIVEVCPGLQNASANFGAAGGNGILTAIAIR